MKAARLSARLSPKCTSSVDRTGKGTAPVDAHESGRHDDASKRVRTGYSLRRYACLKAVRLSARLSPKCTSSVDRIGKGTAPVDAHESGRHDDEIRRVRTGYSLRRYACFKAARLSARLSPKCTSSVDRTGKGTALVDAHESGRHDDEIRRVRTGYSLRRYASFKAARNRPHD